MFDGLVIDLGLAAASYSVQKASGKDLFVKTFPNYIQGLILLIKEMRRYSRRGQYLSSRVPENCSFVTLNHSGLDPFVYKVGSIGKP